jgi:hypothetical protein
VNAFATAFAVLHRDPNLSHPALWRAGGDGAGVAIRVVRQAPDEISDFGQARVVRASMRVSVLVAAVAQPSIGDTIEIAGETFEVAGAPQRDAERLVWTLPLRPVAGAGP